MVSFSDDLSKVPEHTTDRKKLNDQIQRIQSRPNLKSSPYVHAWNTYTHKYIHAHIQHLQPKKTQDPYPLN